MEALLEEQRKTNELLQKLINQNEKDDELLTAEQVVTEYKIGMVMVRKIFKDPELAVQRYTSPHKVKRKNLEKYFEVRHDYLCNS